MVEKLTFRAQHVDLLFARREARHDRGLVDEVVDVSAAHVLFIVPLDRALHRKLRLQCFIARADDAQLLVLNFLEPFERPQLVDERLQHVVVEL